MGIWYLYDVVVVAAGDFRDGDGRRVVRWEVSDAGIGPSASDRRVSDLEDRMLGLEWQGRELAGRLDFAEGVVGAAGGGGSFTKKVEGPSQGGYPKTPGAGGNIR